MVQINATKITLKLARNYHTSAGDFQSALFRGFAILLFITYAVGVNFQVFEDLLKSLLRAHLKNNTEKDLMWKKTDKELENDKLLY